jgi:hypothetical protein
VSNNKSETSQAMFAKISNQMGMDPLSSTSSKIDPNHSDETEIDIDGAVDDHTSSQNPLIQYIVASIIGLLVLGIPLSIMLGIGGGGNQSATVDQKDEKVKVAQTANTDSPEVERLKTQVALDIQSKGTPTQDAGGKPTDTKPAEKPTQPAQPAQPVVATKPAQPVQPVQPVQPIQAVVATRSRRITQPAPVQPTPQLIPIPPVATARVRRQPSVVTSEQRVAMAPRREQRFVRPTPNVATRINAPKPQQVAAVTPVRPTVPFSPIVPTRSNEQAAVAAAKGQIATAPATATASVPKQLSYQEAVALSTIGATDETTVPANTVNVDGKAVALATQYSPALSLPVGVVVEGHTLVPYNSISGGNAATSSDIGVMLDRPIQLAQGYTLPAGTVIQFAMSVANNGMIQTSSKDIYINNTPVKTPPGAFYLTAQDSTALIASQRTLRDGDLVGADIKTGLWGAAGKVGEVLVQSGNTTSIQTGLGGTSTVQSNSANPNIVGAIAQGAFQPLTQAQIKRSDAIATEVQGLSRINTLAVNTRVRIFVAMPGVIQIPIADLPLPSQPRFQATNQTAPAPETGVVTPPPPVPGVTTPNPTVTPSSPPRNYGGARTRIATNKVFVNRVLGLYGSDLDYLG